MAINKLDTGAIQDNAITNAKMADDAVGVADLAATGTPSNTTFLRGDNAWVTPTDTDTNTTYSVQDGELSQNNFTNDDHTKLNNIEASADVTDATNVAAAGAVMTQYVHPNHSGDVVSAADGAMTIQTDAVDIAMLSATGTPGSTTFLRGDNAWATAGSTSASDLTSGTLPMARLSGTLPVLNGSALTNLPSDVAVSATAPSSPSQGDLWFNSSASTVSTIATKDIAIYNGTAWKSLLNIFTATGGTITTSGGYTIHTFTSSGTFTPSASTTVDYLVVAGGGGSGGYGGGGGAGGFRTGTGLAVTAQAYSVTVGAGGSGSDYNGSVASNGGNSVFSSITSLGGGGGAAAGHVGANGGSGGGGNGGHATAGGSGTSGQGNNGGTAVGNSAYHGGGGGGASAVGTAGTSSSGVGGAGTASSYSGSSVTYAGGGGGGTSTSNAGGAGGAGGGGKGFGGDGAATGGSANTGGGGGAGGNIIDASTAGGSGIVIVRYLT